LYADARDWERLASLINKNAPEMIEKGRTKPVETWLSAIPKDRLQQEPWLIYFLGLCRLPFKPDEARIIFISVYEQLKTKIDPRCMTLAICGVIDAILAEQRDFKITKLWVERLKKLRLTNPELFKEDEIIERVTASVFFAFTQILPDHVEFFYWKKQAHKIINNTGNINRRLFIAGCLVINHCWRGELSTAGTIIEKINNIPALKTASPFPLSRWISAEQYYYFNMCLEEPLTDAFNRGLELSKDTGLSIWNAQLYGVMVCWATSAGKLSLAAKYLIDLERALKELHYNNKVQLGIYHLVLGWLNLSKGKMLTAINDFKSTLMTMNELHMVSLEMIAHYGHALALHKCGDEENALLNIEKARAVGSRLEGRLMEFMYMLARSQFAFDKGDEVKGEEFLRKALAIGREYNYINFLLWCPTIMAELAVKAFRYDIETKYVEQLVIRRELIPESPPVDVEGWPWRLKIYTLGRFELKKDNVPITFKGKAPKKPIEMLKVLLALGGKDVRQEQISDVLWPDSDGDAALNAFAVTLKRLRSSLGVDEALTLNDGRLSIDPKYCWVDYLALEKHLDDFNAAANAKDTDKYKDIIHACIALYQGCFLGSDISEPWSVFLCDKLTSKMAQAIRTVAKHLEDTGDYNRAAAYYRKGIEIDELAEEFYQNLMLCYELLGRKAEALREYARLRGTLNAMMDIEPSGKSREIFERISAIA
ncbi:MAG: hypothetical protein IME98_06700, partial [Proteobacteria bacterium]|nr:hypothetical protein [Pseudomonadota bacterium]